MTREDALKVLDTIPTIGEQVDALEMAIKALEQEPCDDAIIRQAAIDGADAIIARDTSGNNDVVKAMTAWKSYVEGLPLVTPQPKIGRWITQWNVVHQKEYYYCSECREEFSYDGETGIKMNDYKYCPNCGVRMEVSE